jgi:RHS repeat-associated protein
MSTVTWVNASGGNWSTASNWSGGVVPGAGDDVVIDVSGNPTITFSSGADTVKSIASNSPLVLSGGTLTVSSTVQVNNTFTINGGTLASATVQAGTGGQGITVGTSNASVLDGDVVNANLDLSANYTLLGIKDGLTLNGTATMSGSSATIDLENSQTVASGTFQFGSNSYLDVEGGTTVTLGSGVTVSGGSGTIGNVYGTGGAHTLINRGTISANVSGQTLAVTSSASYPLTFTNEGTAQAVSGGKLVITPNATSSSAGTLGVDSASSTLTLNGPWAGLGTLSATNSGTMYFGGTFNNVGGTITLPSSGGNWILNGGTITGGTLSIASGAAIAASGSTGNLLVGVTVNGNLALSSYAFLGVKDGLALSGTATLSGSGANLDFLNTQTISSGTFQFSGSSGNMDVEGGTTVTLGSGVNVQGGNGTIGNIDFTGGAHTLINQGTISANVSGQTLTVTSSSSWPLTFTNQGTAQAAGGGKLVITPNATSSSAGTLSVDSAASTLSLNGPWSNLGTLSATNGATMYFGGSFNNAGKAIALPNSGGNWVLNGGTITGGTLNVASGAVLAPSSVGSNVVDGVTVNGNITLGNYGFLGVKDGLTLNGTVNFAASYATVDFLNTQTVTSGTFQFGSSGSGFGLDVEGGTTVTLGSGVNVQGGNGTIGEIHNTGTAHTLINQGTITSNLSGQTLTIGSNYGLTFTNRGTVQAVGGGKLTASAANGATNAGSLGVDSSASTLTLNGPWGGVGTLSATNGGTMNLDGSFSNAGGTIALSNSGGNWILNGGAITGGTLNIASGASVSVSGSTGNLLDGTIVNGNFSLPSYGFMGVKNGLTLNGTVTLGNSAVLDFKNTQTFSGGTVQLPASGNAASIDAEAGATVTFASGVMIAGGIGTIGNTYSGGAAPTLVNQGTISAAGAGSNVALAGTWTALGTLSTASGGVVRLTTAFNNAGQTTTLGCTLTLDGGAIVGGTVNVASGTLLAATSNSNNLLDGVTVNGNLDLTATAAFLGVKDGLTLNGTATLGNSYYYGWPTLDFKNTQTLGGTGTVQFPSSGSANLDVEGGATLTLAAGVTVQGGAGTIGGYYSSGNARTLVNQGTISASVAGQAVSIGGGGLTFINQNIAQATSGSLQFNSANDSTVTIMNSAGTLAAAASGASLTLGGTWASGTVGTLNATAGGTISLTGTFNNANSTFALAGNGGSYLLNGGTINGGTLNVATAAPLTITSGSFAGGVTVDGNLKLTAAGALLGIKDGLTLNGTTTMGGNNSPSFDFQNTGTLGGDATLFLTNGYAGVDVEGGTTLTLAASVTVQGGPGSIGNAYSNSGARTIINYGTISADAPGQTLSIDGGSNLTFINYGLVQQTAAGSSVTFTSNLASLINNGTIAASGGGNVNITPHALTSGGTIHLVGTSTIDDAGTTISSTAAALDGVDVGISWTGLPSDGNATVSLASSSDGTDFTAFAAPLFNASSSLVGNLIPGSTNIARVQSVDNTTGATIICDSPPLTTPNTADQSGWYQLSSPVGSYSSDGYNWTLNGGWIHAGSVEAALAINMVGLIALGNGGPVLGSDGLIHLYHAVGYDTAHTIDYWSWTRPYYPPNAYVVVTIYDYPLGVKTRSGPPASASGGEDPNASGGNPAQNGQSADPVRYFDGSIVYNATDLESDGFGGPFGQIRSWTNLTQYGASGRNGTGMIGNALPFLQQADGSTSVTFVDSGSNQRTFDLNGSSYVPESFVADTLVHANGQFVYTDTSGNQYTFYDFSMSYPAAQRGEFAKLTDAAGNVTYVSALSADGTIAEIRRQDTSGVDGESWLYTYLSATDPNAGLLSNVQMRRPDGQGSWTVERQVNYSYYDGTAPFGNLGDLKTATIEDASGNALDTDYYRYYLAGESGGYAHGLKYVFDSASYARLAAAVGNPFTAPDNAVAPYAQHYFQYDGLRRVTLHTVQGAGGPATGGLGTFTYQYFTSTNPAGPASWQYKTIETLPDGNQNIVYCNSLGEVMLKVYNDVSDPANSALSGKQWDTFYGYDVQGRLTEEADPSAVTGYDETKADLLNNQNGNYQYLSDTSGLIHLTDYYTSTTATATAAGGVAGYVKDDKLQHGELGTPIVLDSQQYFAHANGSVVTYPQASQTVYRNTDGTGAETATFAYTWYPNSSQAQSMTTSKPVVSAAENGPGTSDVSTVFYDPYGRIIWSMDADGYVNYTGYDTGTGAIVQTITDVDYSKLSTALQQSFNLTGWAQPIGGLHLVTGTVVDGLGRPVQITDPNGNVTYMTYDDVNHEIRTYSGWNAATGMPTGPTIVVRQDMAGSYTETLTMSATPHLTDGVPDGTEPISNIQSLERQYTDAANQVVEVDQYFNLQGVTYSTAAHIGKLNTNYYATIYGFDVNGHQARVQDAVGTITDTLFDALGRATAAYVGTNDSTTDGNPWSPSNAAAASNMVEVSADQYDGNGVGDGNLTQETVFPDSNAADNRVSVDDYDWRDRLVATKAGVQATEDSTTSRPLSVSTLDNLGEVTVQSTYDGDAVSMADANQDGVPDALDPAKLRAQITNSYDEQGRVYQRAVSVIDQNTGAVVATLTTNTWYDHRGNPIKVQSPSGLVTKSQYDGADRMTLQSTTDGGGDSTWADAANVTGDVVWQQVQNVYDADSNVTETITKLRDGDDPSTATGALGDLNNDPKARVSYVASYFDAANRVIDVLNVGTNGGIAFTPQPVTSLVSDDTHLLAAYGYDAAGFQSTITDPRRIVTKTLRDALGRPTSVIADYTDGTPTNNSNQTTDFTYDGIGHVLSKTLVQPAGTPSETTAYLYGVTGNIFSDDLIAGTEYPDPTTGNPSPSNEETDAYDRLGEVTSKTEPNGSSIASAFDVLGRLRSQTVNTTDGSGNPNAQFTYDTLGNVASQTDALGNVTTFDHDSLGRKTQEVQPDPDGHSGHPTTAWTYDAAGNLIAITDPRGNATSFAYDLLNRQVQETLPDPDGSGPLVSPVITSQYNVGGNENTTTDPLGNVSGANPALHTTINVLDPFGRVAETIQPSPDGISAQPTTSYGYDRDGNQTSVTDALGNTTTAAYDNLNRKIQVTTPDPDGSGPLTAPVTYYAYDALGNLFQVTDPLGHATNYQYDALNRKTETIQPSPDGVAPRPTTLYGYDVSNNLTSVTDAQGQTTTYGYNQLNEKVSETDPDPDGAGPLTTPVTTWQYDANRNVIAQTDPLGNAPGGNPAPHTTNYAYDNLNRKTGEVQPSPDGVSARPAISFTYDSVGNLLTETDPDGNTTTNVYDNLNREISTADQKGNPAFTSYDANGNVVSTTDRNGQVTQFTYDNLDRQITEQWLDASSNVIHTITSAYDLLGRLTSVSDPDSATTYAYDNLNRPTTITINYTGLSSPIVLNQSFDAAGQRTSLTTNLGLTADLANAYLFDALGRLTQVQQSSNGGNAVAAKQVNFAYNADGQVTGLSRYSDTSGSNLVASTAYGYDQDSRLTSLVHTLGAPSTQLTYGLGYDANSQITTLTTPDGTSDLGYDNNGQLTGASLTSESYSYDANGNRTSGGTTATTDNQLASDATYTYTYDKNGNMTGKVRKDGTGSTLYAWDSRNRLTDVTFEDGSGTVTGSVHYAYDANNNRISKTVKDAAGNVTLSEFYGYDGSNLLLVLDGSGNVKNRYLNGPSEDQVLAEETNITSNGAGDTHWALTDHEGSVRDVVGNSGTVLDHIQYDSFGNVLSQTDAAYAMRMGYTGQVQDAETGLNYDHARYYDPATGRFLSTDPSGFSAGDTNLYRYVNNSPLDNTDPTGLCADGTNPPADQNGAMTQAKANQIVAQAKADLAISNGTATAGDIRVRRDELVSDGMSQQQADATVAPLVSDASARANQQMEDSRYANGDLTASEKLQGSGSILANTFTFGGSDAMGWTDSNRYQGAGFDAARVSAGISRDAAIVLVTGGAGATTDAAAVTEESTAGARSLVGSLEDWESTANAADRIAARDAAFEADNAAVMQQSGDRQALSSLIKEATRSGNKPLSVEDANTVLDWAQEQGIQGVRASEGDVSVPSNWTARPDLPHIHIPNTGVGTHIPVEPGLTPRT